MEAETVHFRPGGRFLSVGKCADAGSIGRTGLARTAFTLTELIVSMGVLALMLVLVGKVFSIAVDSTNQARSLMDVSHDFRLLEESLRADLRGIDPRRSMLVISGNPINAYWTEDGPEIDSDGDPETGYPHPGDADREVFNEGINGSINPPWRLELPRSDILMAFTSQPSESVHYPDVRSTNVQVVWGHAELGDLNSDGDWKVDPLPFPPQDDTNPFWDAAAVDRGRYIARNWHLARRPVVLVDSPDKKNLEDLLSIIANDTVVIDDPPPGTLLGDGATSGLAADHQGMIRDGRMDIVLTSAFPSFDFEYLVAEGFSADMNELPPSELATWYKRSQLDESPPSQQANRLGHYLLPGCASMKIEWTFSHPALKELNEVVWVDPADRPIAHPNNKLKVVTQLERLFPGGIPADIQVKFTESMPTARFNPDTTANPWMAEEPGTHVFFSRDPDAFAGGSSEADPFFPTALRVTVDVFDRGGKFERPIRHVMVLPVGKGS